MVVAMDANALACVAGVCRGNGPGTSEELDASTENECCIIGDNLCELGHAALQSAKRNGYRGVDAVRLRGEIVGGERLGDEGRVVSGGSKPKVHLGGITAQQSCGVDVQTCMLASQGTR